MAANVHDAQESAMPNVHDNDETMSPQKAAGKLPAVTPSTEAGSPASVVTPEVEAYCLASALPQIGVATEEVEAESWVADSLSAETPTEEDLAWVECLPKLRSEVPKAPSSWMADALTMETMDAEYDLAWMPYLPKLSTSSPKADQVSWMSVALSDLAVEGEEIDADEAKFREACASIASRGLTTYILDGIVEEENFRKACASIASRGLAKELSAAKFRRVLRKTCAIAAAIGLVYAGFKYTKPSRATCVGFATTVGLPAAMLSRMADAAL